jgi:hypothetical protein
MLYNIKFISSLLKIYFSPTHLLYYQHELTPFFSPSLLRKEGECLPGIVLYIKGLILKLF